MGLFLSTCNFDLMFCKEENTVKKKKKRGTMYNSSRMFGLTLSVCLYQMK